MKNYKFLIILLIVIAGFSPLNETKAQLVDVSFSTFQSELSPYGRWMNNPRFGQVWINNQAGFRPYYSDGHWDYTNYGWEWVSDFDWGWAPFHYGRWEYDAIDGWMWIPGYEWAPAWVSWSSYDNYYGWAPLGYGNEINVSFGSIPYERWTFIPRQNICDRDIRRYYVSSQGNYGFRNAVIINNIYDGGRKEGRFFRGPDRVEVERYTHNQVEERKIDYQQRPGLVRVTSNDQNNNGNRNNNDHPGRINNNDNNNLVTPVRHENEIVPVQPNRDIINNPNRNPGNRQNDNRNNNQQHDNFPVRQQQTTSPVNNNNQQHDNFPRKPQQTTTSPVNNNTQQHDNFPRRQQTDNPVRQQRTEPSIQQPKNEHRQENQKPAENNRHGSGKRGG